MVERIVGIAIIESCEHDISLSRCEITLCDNTFIFNLLDSNDQLLYGYDEFDIDIVEFSDKNSVYCYLDKPIFREDEKHIDVSRHTKCAKVFLSSSGYKSLISLATTVNKMDTSSDEIDSVPSESDSSEDDSTESVESDSTTEQPAKRQKTEKIKSDEPKKKGGWFSWLF